MKEGVCLGMTGGEEEGRRDLAVKDRLEVEMR